MVDYQLFKRGGRCVLLLLLFLILAVSCQKEQLPSSDQTLAEVSSETIPLEEALQTLSIFLDEEPQVKSSMLKSKSFTVSSWPEDSGTKAGGAMASIYIVDFDGDEGTAVLAADRSIPEPILCVTEKSSITTELLDKVAGSKNVGSSGGIRDSESFPKIDENDLVDLEMYDIGYDIVAEYILGQLGGNENIKDNPDELLQDVEQPTGPEPKTKFGPYLQTKWGQKEPFNSLMYGSDVGCGPVAVAQTIYFLKNKIVLGNDCEWNWELLVNVKPYWDPWNYIFSLSDEEKINASKFMLDVKTRCGMKSTETGAVVGQIQKCLKSFGFSGVKHDFAHFGGDRHDLKHIDENVSRMIKYGKPIVMLSGYYDSAAKLKEKLGGHVFVLDGYRKDDTGEYLHINWGWSGGFDGYYAKGCFDLTQRANCELDVDNSGSGNDVLNFNYFHYYVYFD